MKRKSLLILAFIGLVFAPFANAGDIATGGGGSSTDGLDISGRDWSGGVDFGGTYLQGNSDVLHLYGGIEAISHGVGDELILGLEGVYGKSNGVKDAEWVRAYSQYTREIAEPFYYGMFSDFLHDDIADLRYRFTINPLFGMYVFKNERSSLAIEAGPAFVIEEQAGISDSYFALRFAERFEFKLSDRTRFWQSLEYMPEVSDFGNYILIGEAGIETLLGRNVSLKTFVQNRYDNQPAPGIERNDFGFFLALSFSPDKAESFGGGGGKSGKAIALDTVSSDWLWVGTAGASILSGNTDSTLISAAFDGIRRGNGTETGLGVYGGYAEVSNVTTAEQYGAYLFHNVDVTPRVYVGGRLSYLHDSIANIEYQVAAGMHVGYRIIDTDRTHLKAEVGGAYVFEKQNGSDSYFAVRAGEYFDHQFNDTCKFFQSFEYFGEAADLGNYTILNKVGIDTAIFNGWAWTNAIVHSYDNTPAAGFVRNDVAIISGLKKSF